MANRNLKQAFEQIRIEEGELDSYRAELAAALPQTAAKPSNPPKLLLLIPLAAALLMYLTYPETHFRQQTMDEVVALVAQAENPVALGRRAELRFRSPKQEDHLNAIAVLTLTQMPKHAIQMAATGLQEDPRPDFRAFYLEFLLENADEYRFNLDLVETLMDRETNPLCLALFKDLLNLAT